MKNKHPLLAASFFFVALVFFIILNKVVYDYLPAYYFKQGYIRFNQKNYVESYSYFKKAYILNNTNKDYRYYYVKTLTKLSPTITIQKEIYEIANGNETDSAQQAAEKQVRDWRFNAIKNAGDNYIEQSPMEKGIIRWDTSKFPLRVSIISDKDINIPDYYIIQIKKAISQWQSAVNILKFTLTDKDPNIIIKITKTPGNLCEKGNCRFIVGYTTPEFHGNILKKMLITLYSNDPYGNYFSDKELYNTILHEIGHALGIMGHSYSSEDLMYMSHNSNDTYSQYKSDFQYITSKDINTIKLLYTIAPDITNSENIDTKGLIYAPIIFGSKKEINEKKLNEALYYVKKAPDLAGGYIDLGIAYAELNKPKDAINSFQKAYNLSKSNIEKYRIMYNLSITYFNINDYENALKCAQMAQNINDSEEIKDLIMNIKHEKFK